jgi:hypothetical protein
MRKYFIIFIGLLIGCQSKPVYKAESRHETSIEDVKSKELEKLEESEQHFRDSLYKRESDHYISKLEEIPNREDDAYRITIKSKNGSWKKTKVMNTRPRMSRISDCNDLYTVVGFPCGGPCHSEVFVFTSKTKPDEQYDYVEIVKNKPNMITHFRNEEFENLIVRNLTNNKEMNINISEIELFSLDFIDSVCLNKNDLNIFYTTQNDKQKIKTTNVKAIL